MEDGLGMGCERDDARHQAARGGLVREGLKEREVAKVYPVEDPYCEQRGLVGCVAGKFLLGGHDESTRPIGLPLSRYDMRLDCRIAYFIHARPSRNGRYDEHLVRMLFFCAMKTLLQPLQQCGVVSALRPRIAGACPVVKRTAQRVLVERTAPLIALWILLVLYPNPLNLAVSVYRVFSPTINPEAVEPLLVGLPDDPEGIEREILLRIPYHYDWEVHGMPWYFPTVEKVVEKGAGDCKARAIVLASVFERLGIPYRFNSSFVHVWVEYEGKAETSLENPRAKFYQQDPETGQRLFQLPDIDWALWLDSTKQGLWVVMPLLRKVLLLGGIALIIAARVLLRQNTFEPIDKPMVI